MRTKQTAKNKNTVESLENTLNERKKADSFTGVLHLFWINRDSYWVDVDIRSHVYGLRSIN